MPARTTAAKVKGIIRFDPSIDDVSPMIETANQLVTELCANVSPSPGYDADRLEMIERWLAAHFLAVQDPRYVSESLGAASVSYQQGQLGMNLSMTPYGQQALLLDTAGALAQKNFHVAQGKRAKVGMAYLGTKHYNNATGQRIIGNLP